MSKHRLTNNKNNTNGISNHPQIQYQWKTAVQITQKLVLHRH